MKNINAKEYAKKMQDIIKRVAPFETEEGNPFTWFAAAEKAGAISHREKEFIRDGFMAFTISNIKDEIKAEKGDN